MLTLLVATTAVLVAAAVLAAHLTPRGAVAYLLALLLLAQAMIVTTVGFAGLVVHSLAPGVLLGLAAGWLAAAAVLAWTRRGTLRWRSRAARYGASIRSAVASPAVAIAVLLVLGTLAWRLFLVLRLPVVDYDGWSYHLVFVDVWLQHDALVDVLQRPWTAGYPADTELLTTWLAAFTRTDALAGLTSLAPIPLAIVATTGLARELGASRTMALLAGLLLGMTPALVALAGTTYVDASSAATVIATWWLGLRVIRRERDGSAALLLGVAGGLALGTKGTNVLLVAPVLTVAGIVLLRDLLARRGQGIGAPIARLGLLVLPVLALGASWYLKNAVEFGNPLYPFAMGPLPGPTTLTDFAFVPRQLEGKSWLGQVLASWIADWHLTHYAYNVRPGGLGRAWPLVLPIAALGVAVLARRRRMAPLAIVVLPAVVVLLIMPMPWYARLTLFVPGIALPLAAVALDAFHPRLRTVGALVLVAVAAVSLGVANVRPNIDLRPAVRDTGARHYLGLLLDSDAARRSNVSLRAACAGFDVIPAGSRVAPGGFNLLHGVVGPNLDRILTDPLGPVSTPAELADELRRQGATWLVTSLGGGVDQVAAAAPDLFAGHGEICGGARLWELQSGS